jgi:hypothetical protein
VAFAELELPAPLNDWGVIKGLLLRHFRWWSKRDDMFNVDGTLTIGFAYPNMYMCEDYNSPQSPYWALKSFLALGLPETHPFWNAREKPVPRINGPSAVPIKPPMHIICDSGNHHFLLSMGQYCPWPLKATEAKYGKYAYSSHFGFSVPTGTLIQQIAPDNTLALSKDGGDTWRVPWKVTDPNFGTATVRSKKEVTETLPTLKSIWKPWRDADIEVTTHLIPPSTRWPDWHVRVHQIRNTSSNEANIDCVQGGFAVQGRGSSKGEVLTAFNETTSLTNQRATSFPEGTTETAEGVLICSNAGSSGIRQINVLSPQEIESPLPKELHRAEVLKPDANTNLMWQRTLIPTVKSEIRIQKSAYLVSAVFALARTSDREQSYSSLDIAKLWEDVPIVSALAGGGTELGWYITLD